MYLCLISEKLKWLIFLELFVISLSQNFIINSFESKFESNYNLFKDLFEFLNSKDIYFYEIFNSSCTTSLIENIEALELSKDTNMFYLYLKLKNEIRCFINKRTYLLNFIFYESISLRNDKIKTSKNQNLMIFNKKKPLLLLYRTALNILLNFMKIFKKIENIFIASEIELVLAPFLLNEKDFRNLNFFILRQIRSSSSIFDFFILKKSKFFAINIGKQQIKQPINHNMPSSVLYILNETKYRFHEEIEQRFTPNHILNEKLLNIEVYVNTYTIVEINAKNKESYIHESHKKYEFLNYIKKTAKNIHENHNSNEFIFILFGSNAVHLKIDIKEKHLTKNKMYYTARITFIESILFEEYFFEFDEIYSKIGDIKSKISTTFEEFQPERVSNLESLLYRITFYKFWHLYQSVE
ncbi:hypothetical protein CWI38_1040p0030 [Hamiltosporidium tvaerminnensis]|uniref:Uncharacterized protein n=1 Tax=Hamiltosporidium tvaerminnensis TaxID=1176355 RepID=A0A4Q9LTG4_9MICR|nr:hypothetical protein CWI37_0794p0020 [Hamiltosporidium tvaerminnensis]TBU11784.1 hypothetical protein CWI38_1040p0030 [Hamiltosporidium tvaerminnensis]